MDIPYGYIYAAVIGTMGGTCLGLWLSRRVMKTVVKNYRSALRRASRRNILVNTTRIDHTNILTTLTLNGAAVLKMWVTSESPVQFHVINRNGDEIPSDGPVDNQTIN